MQDCFPNLIFGVCSKQPFQRPLVAFIQQPFYDLDTISLHIHFLRIYIPEKGVEFYGNFVFIIHIFILTFLNSYNNYSIFEVMIPLYGLLMPKIDN